MTATESSSDHVLNLANFANKPVCITALTSQLQSLPDSIIVWQTVVTTSLYVHGGQVEAIAAPAREQHVAHIIYHLRETRKHFMSRKLIDLIVACLKRKELPSALVDYFQN